uniref:EGF-like domain-containing protein n=1 Tax=Plectus sambesii TaxID=2011161 RepID=A0A914W9W7_9BILA
MSTGSGTNVYKCICVPGTNGTYCTNNIDECVSNPCPSNYKCIDEINGYNCDTCASGFKGPYCNYTSSDNCYPDPCNGEQCVSPTGTCNCTTGKSGTHCELLTPCDSSPCVTGTCSSLLGGKAYYCACSPPNQGVNCEINTLSATTSTVYTGCFKQHSCTSSWNSVTANNLVWSPLKAGTCQTKAINVNKVEAFGLTIGCGGGNDCCYTGTFADLTSLGNSSDSNCASSCWGTSPCGKKSSGDCYAAVYTMSLGTSDPINCAAGICLNGGTCVELVGATSCVCASGWTGTNCATDYNECISNPCVSGTCVNGANSFTCTCPDWAAGSLCEIDNSCSYYSVACQNGGTCIPNKGSWSCECYGIYSGSLCDEFNDCYYNQCVHGTCNDLTVDDYTCTCNPGYTEKNCDLDINECSSDPCLLYPAAPGSANCTQGVDLWECFCNVGFDGLICGNDIDECQSNPCIFGNCTEGIPGFYICTCIPGYYGPNCENETNECASNPCVHGTCNDMVNMYNCTCQAGYTDYNCSTEINECTSTPCHYGGNCTDHVAYYTCSCVPGSSGYSCEENIDECASDPCIKYDKAATCIDELNGFLCACAPDWTGKVCDLEMIIWNVIKTFENTPLDITLLKDLISKSSLIKDMIPFILGLMSKENQTALSWEYEDLFEWVSFDGQPLNLTESVLKWNEATLGNCFTYNHENITNKDKLTRAGQDGAFRALLKVDQEEYLPWVDTSAMMIFVHNQSEGIFGESVRYNAIPGAKTSLSVRQSVYKRLGGKYGECVNSKSEVKSYYYPGEYSTPGCLRSCYQDAVFAACKCMDPRYPTDDVAICDLSQRSCVDDFVAATGDPSRWSTCYCPLPCRNGQFDIAVSTGKTMLEPLICNYTNTNRTACLTLRQRDYLEIEVYFDSMLYSIFEEDAAMGFTDLLNALGGLIGLLCGVSVVTLVELGFAIVQIIFVVFTGKG